MRIPHLRLEIDAVVAADWPEHCVIFSGVQQPNGYGRVCVDSKYQCGRVEEHDIIRGRPFSPGTPQPWGDKQ